MRKAITFLVLIVTIVVVTRHVGTLLSFAIVDTIIVLMFHVHLLGFL